MIFLYSCNYHIDQIKVFISHSSADKRFVRKLTDDLLENNFKVWVDEDYLFFGDYLRSDIKAAIEESSHFIVILSETAIESFWVNFEIGKAVDQKKAERLQRIIPIKYTHCEIPPKLKELVFADLWNAERVISRDRDTISFVDDNSYDHFFKKLCRSLRKPPVVKRGFKEIVKKSESEPKQFYKPLKDRLAHFNYPKFCFRFLAITIAIVLFLFLPLIWESHRSFLEKINAVLEAFVMMGTFSIISWHANQIATYFVEKILKKYGLGIYQ